MQDLERSLDRLHELVPSELLVSYVFPVTWFPGRVADPQSGDEVLLVPKLSSVNGTHELGDQPR